jgi:hypothetical protein
LVPGRTGLIYNIFTIRDGNHLHRKEQKNLEGQTTPEMRTITYNGEATPWIWVTVSHRSQIALLKR